MRRSICRVMSNFCRGDGRDPDGGNSSDTRPADSDPYIVQGAPDEEWNRLYRKGGMN